MAKLDSSVYVDFYNDAEVVKLMILTAMKENLVMEINDKEVQVGLLATMLKFNHLVEFFKKISRNLADEYYNKSYIELNSVLDDEEREVITKIFSDRNYISHMISEKALRNPPWVLRSLNECTQHMEATLHIYLENIPEKNLL